MTTSINTNIAAYFAQANIATSSNLIQSNVARLSSGNAIVQASDNVAALATGTSLGTQVGILQTAQNNAAQGTSLLQVADGSLAQIQSILQQQESLANQAQSGSLTDTDRGFLNQQFQTLTNEIDALAGGTQFNGVNLIDGSLSQAADITDNTTHSTAGSLQLNFNNGIASGQTAIIDGVTLTAATTSSGASGANFALGSSLSDTVANLATQLNAMSASPTYAATIGQATYSSSGSTLVITAKSGGALSNTFTVSSAGTATTSGGGTVTGNGAGNDSSFNLWTTAVADANITSASTQLSASTSTAAHPFQQGDNLIATVNGATTTLYTFGATDTVSQVVAGINNNTATTGFSAALVYDGTGYNIRLSYAGTGSNIIIDGGTHFNATTLALGGQAVDTANSEVTDATAAGAAYNGPIEVAAGATDSSYMFYTKNVQLTATTTDLTAANASATVTAAVGSTTAAAPFAVGDNLTVTINGQARVLTTFQAAQSLQTVIDNINTNSAQTGVMAVLQGADGGFGIRLYVNDPNAQYTAASGGPNANAIISAAAAAAAANPITQTPTSALGGGADNGLGQASTAVTGSVGNNLLTALSQTPTSESVTLSQNADAGDHITVGGQIFYFTNNTATAANEITIGSSITQTIDNAVSKINSFLTSGDALGTTAYELNQLNITRSGDSLVFTGKDLSNITTLTGAASTITNNITGASTAGGLSNAPTTYGVNMTGLTNPAAIGQNAITGFSGTYVSPDVADLSVTIGKYTYTAQNVTTNPATNSDVRLYSNTLADGTNGGYFDIQLQGGDGVQVGSQTDVNTLADNLNTAFSSLNFYQNHQVSSYDGTQNIVVNNSVIGSLVGSKVSAQLATFTGDQLSNVSVTAPSGSVTDAKITLTINGVDYTTQAGLGSTLGANQSYKLVSATDPNQFVTFTTGNSGINLSSAANATAFQQALFNAFGASSGAAALTFQLGSTSSANVKVSLDSATSNSLFGGATLDISTAQDAATAAAAVNTAINSITAQRATVGAFESQFNFATAALQSSVQNQSAAESSLLDTNIATESTAYATNQVKLQAGISVLAQANQQLQALLKLIG